MTAALALLLVLAGPALAWGQTGGAASPSGATPAVSIPVAEVARQAEEVGDFLRSVDATLAPNARITGIETDLPPLSERIGARLEQTRKTLEAQPSLGVLDSLADTWQPARLTLIDWVETLTTQATRLDAQRTRLQGFEETWTRTRADARAGAAPAPIIERIDAVLASLEAARRRVEAGRAATLVLQDRVARELSRCEEALAQLAEARRRAAVDLFTRDSPPIWRLRPLSPSEARTALGATFDSQGAAIRQLIRDQANAIAVHAALVIGLTVLFVLARRRERTREAGAPTSPLGLLLGRPVAAAIVLGFLASFWVYSTGPRIARTFAEIGSLMPLVLILRRLVPPPVLAGVYALTAFFLVDRLRELIVGLPLLERYGLLIEVLAAAGVLAWFIRAGRARKLVDEMGPITGEAVRISLGLTLVGFLLAFLSAFSGNMSLARLVTSAIFASGYLALMLEAGRRLANGLVSFALRARPLSGLRTVEQYRPLLEGRAHAALRAIGVAAWIVGTLDYFGLLTPAWEGAGRVLGAELTRGALSISLGDIIAFALTAWLSFVLSSFVRFVLQEEVFPHVNLQPGVPYALSTFVGYAIVFMGLIVALLVLGVNLDRVTVLGGALGVGVGFGLQNIVNNFVSGLIVLFERPVRVGDAVQVGDVQGQVRRIGIRSSTVAAWEGAEVIVPNSMLVSEKVTNWTPTVYRRRLDIPVNVAYGTAPEDVLKLLVDVAATHPDVTKQPPPEAFFLGFGDSALRFQLNSWTTRLDRHGAVRSELGVAIYAALRKAGMTIPLPQQEVRLHREPPAVDGGAILNRDRQPDRSPEGERE